MMGWFRKRNHNNQYEQTTDGQPPRLPDPEPPANLCSLCGNTRQVPPGGNPDAHPVCINCDRIPRGEW